MEEYHVIVRQWCCPGSGSGDLSRGPRDRFGMQSPRGVAPFAREVGEEVQRCLIRRTVTPTSAERRLAGRFWATARPFASV